jgi:hypothetical protein
MLVTLLGIVTPVRPVQTVKAPSPTFATLFGISKAPVFPVGYECKKVLFLLYSTPFSEVYTLFPADTLIAVRLEPLKAPSPMLVTLLGIVTLARLLQLLKAPYPMLVTLLGMVTLPRLVQMAKAVFPMLLTLLGIVMPVRLVQLPKDHSPIPVNVLPEKSRLTYLFAFLSVE